MNESDSRKKDLILHYKNIERPNKAKPKTKTKIINKMK